MSSGWDEWPCSHDCTIFFKIAPREVESFLPKPLVLDVDKKGRAHIEIGYARFRPSHGMPAFEELSWGIGVKPVGKGFKMAFYCPSLTSNEEKFLTYNEQKLFTVYRPEGLDPTVRFRTDLDRRVFEVGDASGKICSLRHQPEGSFRLPFFLKWFFLGKTEVWTGTTGNLHRRTFKWKGVARVHLAPPVASNIYDHPFFQGAKVSNAEPLGYELFSSDRVANATQLFTDPVPA